MEKFPAIDAYLKSFLFTTTGSSIYDVELCQKAYYFGAFHTGLVVWGLVFILAILPWLEERPPDESRKSGASGRKVEILNENHTAIWLYSIYIILTIILFIFLLIAVCLYLMLC